MGIEAEQLIGAPQTDMSAGFELNMVQSLSLREVLQSFALISRPVRASSDLNATKKDIAEAERVYRPTFCRFIVDSNLCSHVDAKYHFVARMFDALASAGSSRQEIVGQQIPRQFAAVGSTSVDMCVSIICQLLAHTPNPAQAANNLFHDGLGEAQKIAEALKEDSRERSIVAVRMAAEDAESDTKEENHKEFMKILGSPPQFFTGSLRDW